ncbi:RICIN domain-containing protein (plasmid) [Streptomyces sp. NBC_01136]|uniref:RICIN domain-containing protein n=1 Tax=unclassified Streptomyces TaxID=2593676 RepID=UPI002F91103B|nr:RICIN domain-containing protein [Streptomyces sp. NBC_01136]
MNLNPAGLAAGAGTTTRKLGARRVRRAFGALLATGALTAGALAATAGTANAAGFTVRIIPLTNPFLTVEVLGGGKSLGDTVDVWSGNGGANQIWTFSPVSGGYNIINKNSGMCLTTDGVAGHTLYQFACVGNVSQVWSTGLTPGSLYAYKITNPNSGLVMDVYGDGRSEGTPIDGWTPNGADNQYFTATAA